MGIFFSWINHVDFRLALYIHTQSQNILAPLQVNLTSYTSQFTNQHHIVSIQNSCTQNQKSLKKYQQILNNFHLPDIIFNTQFFDIRISTSTPIIMTQLLKEYSLTQYTEFRKLQLQYFKMKDQNEELRSKLQALEELYQKAMRTSNESKRQVEMMRSQLTSRTKQDESQKSQIEKQLKQINELLLALKPEQPKSYKFHKNQPLHQKLQRINTQLEQITQQFHKLKVSVKQIAQQSARKQQKWLKKQQNFSAQIAELQIDLSSLQKIQAELQLENEKIIRQNEELVAQIKSYKTMAIEARNQRKQVKTLPNQIENDFNQEDKDFATDLLGYEKQLLSRIFGLVIESFEKDEIQICLKKIYEAYEDVTLCYRQKLQIEYDLSDLQCQYQKTKGTNSKQALIELRKQINSFRKELFNQKELLHKRQDILQQRIKDLSGQAIHDNRLKNFTIGLQTKLRKQKSVSQENDDRIVGDLSKVATVEFRHNMETDEIVKQMIQKDRQNLEKMLKETRHQFRR